MKIVGIGLNKTGTSTLGAAGAHWGLRVKTWDPVLFNAVIVEGNLDALWTVVDANDLFNDFPYPLLYREIDARYPGAKFILTRRRNPETWLRSIKAHAMRASPSSRTNEVVYGARYPQGAEERYLDYYERHNAAARSYFSARPEAFLEICWEEEGDWSRLAEFVGLAAPAGPIEQANAASAKMVNPLRYAWNQIARRLPGRRT